MHRINLRELGGYPVNQGKKVVKTNHLYRSGEISDLSLEDIRYLQNLGLSFICDLRSKEEQEQHPNPPIEGVEMFSNPALGGAVAVQSLDQLLPALMNHRLTEDPLLGVYKQFVTDEQSKQAYRLLIRTILQSGGVRYFGIVRQAKIALASLRLSFSYSLMLLSRRLWKII